MVLIVQVRRQQPDRRQRKGRGLDQLEDDWIPPRRPARLDAVVGATLGQVQHLRAVREHRGTAFAEIQAPGVDLAERAQQRHGRMPFLAGQSLCGLEQGSVGEVRESFCRRHSPFYHGAFRKPREHASTGFV